MLVRTIITAAAVLGLGIGNGFAAEYKAQPQSHRRHASAIPYGSPAAAPSSTYGGTLVLHPASNIACNTVYRSTRALPCDQPVWVYGSPCEIDLGLGRYRACE